MCNPGSLNSRDQLRSRSRLLNISRHWFWSISTFSTVELLVLNCHYFLNMSRHWFWSVITFSTCRDIGFEVSLLSQLSSYWFWSVNTFNTVETLVLSCQYFLNCRDIGFKLWRSWVSINQDQVRIASKILGHTPCWNVGFWAVKIKILDQNHAKRLRVLGISHVETWFLNCQDFLDSWDFFQQLRLWFWNVKIESLNQDHVKRLIV